MDFQSTKDLMPSTETTTGARVSDLSLVSRRYRTILVDPPWPYRDSGIRGGTRGHYHTMSFDELSALPISRLAHPGGAAFWIWTTWPMLREGTPHRLLAAWGIPWRGEMIWDKLSLGTGRVTRSRTEILIVAVTGRLTLASKCVDPVIQVRRRARHSEKPRQFYEVIEELSPGPRIELFARSARNGWDRWGAEAP